MLEEIADAIIDWRDENDTPEGLGVEGGYYESLTFGYSARNGPFKTLRELLLVRDMTDDLFYGEDTNLNGELDYNERDGDLSPPLDDGDDVLDVGWAAYLTCYSAVDDIFAHLLARVTIDVRLRLINIGIVIADVQFSKLISERVAVLAFSYLIDVAVDLS